MVNTSININKTHNYISSFLTEQKGKTTTYDGFGGVKLVNGNTTLVQYRYKQNDIIFKIDNTTDKIRLENL